MTTTTGLEVRRLLPADEADVLSLLTTTMAGGPTGSRTSEFFSWKHRGSPFGASPGLVATEGDQIVGVRLFMRWQLCVGARALSAFRAVDTATHPDYQRRGIFRTLTLGLLEQLEREEDIDLVFNTPNTESRPGYLRMGWQDVGLLPVHVSPVHPLRFLRGARAASAATASGSPRAVTNAAPSPQDVECPLPRAGDVLASAEDVTRLLGQRRVPRGLHTPLSLDYLSWRYGQAPGLDYRGIEVRRRGRLVALGLGRVRSRAGLTEFTLGDVLVAAGDHRAARSVLHLARRTGVDHVAVHAGSGTEIARMALASGYVPTPGSGIRLVANVRKGSHQRMLATSGWTLSLGDLEVF